MISLWNTFLLICQKSSKQPVCKWVINRCFVVVLKCSVLETAQSVCSLLLPPLCQIVCFAWLSSSHSSCGPPWFDLLCPSFRLVPPPARPSLLAAAIFANTCFIFHHSAPVSHHSSVCYITGLQLHTYPTFKASIISDNGHLGIIPTSGIHCWHCCSCDPGPRPR